MFSFLILRDKGQGIGDKAPGFYAFFIIILVVSKINIEKIKCLINACMRRISILLGNREVKG